MTRILSFLAVTTTAAFLAFRGAAAFAAATGGDGNGQPGGPGAGNPGGPGGVTPRVYSCDYRADQQGLEGPARQAFVWRCQQGGAF